MMLKFVKFVKIRKIYNIFVNVFLNDYFLANVSRANASSKFTNVRESHNLLTVERACLLSENNDAKYFYIRIAINERYSNSEI